MAKKELFSYPLLGKTMRLGGLVPVDRGNRDAGIAAVRAAAEVIRQGVNMTIFIEGGRSFDGKLLRFKKGPFYLAEECEVPVVPVTISGTHYVMPKRRFAVKPGNVDVIFHDPIEPKDFRSREALIVKVWEAINAGLPAEYQQNDPPAAMDRSRKESAKQA
jgi:1-acyl-sn-glycerol-3-phosphate acyltransferase